MEKIDGNKNAHDAEIQCDKEEQKQPQQIFNNNLYEKLPDKDKIRESIENKFNEIKNYGAFKQNDAASKDIENQQEKPEEDQEVKKKWCRCYEILTKWRGDDDRQDFLFKVFLIETIQMAVVSLVVAFAGINEAFGSALEDNFWIYFVALGVTIGLSCLMLWLQNIGRSFPCNYTFLFLFMSSFSIALVTLAGIIKPSSCFICYSLFFMMFLSLAFISLTTKHTFLVIFIFMLVVVNLTLFSLILFIFFTAQFITIIVFASISALSSLYFIINIGWMIERYKLTFDEYAFTSVQIYLDIIMIFVYIFKLLCGKKEAAS